MKPTRIALPLALVALVAVFGLHFAMAADHSQHSSKPQAAQKGQKAKNDGAPYPLDTCPVTGEKLGSMGAPVVYNYKGREIKFCCKSCPAKFEADPAKYIAEIDKKIIAKQVASYPLDTCVVTGEKLGTMGKPVDYVYKNRLVRFCCKSCIAKFDTDPAKYLKKIEAARAKSKS
jgi:YHS domain-containing protein